MVVREFTSPSGNSFSQIAFSADGAAIGATTGTEVVLFSASDGTVLWVSALPNDTSFSIAFSPDNQYVAVGSALRHRVYLLRRSDGTIAHEWARHTRAVGAVHFTPDSQRVVSSALDGLICLWRLDNFTLESEYLIGDAGMLCCNDTQSDYRRPPLKLHHTHQTHTTTKKLRCKLYTTPFANTSRRAKRNFRLRTPSPNLRLITEITVSTFQR